MTDSELNVDAVLEDFVAGTTTLVQLLEWAERRVIVGPELLDAPLGVVRETLVAEEIFEECSLPDVSAEQAFSIVKHLLEALQGSRRWVQKVSIRGDVATVPLRAGTLGGLVLKGIVDGSEPGTVQGTLTFALEIQGPTVTVSDVNLAEL